MSFITVNSCGPAGDGQFNLPTGRFPDQITHTFGNPLLYSNGATQKIKPLHHIQTIRIDTIPNVPHPYNMELQLPVITRLPNAARIYFFYLAECTDGDSLKFIPTPLSGESVDGNVTGKLFPLYGQKVLFVCFAVDSNWIVQPFGQNAGNPPPPPPPISNILTPGVISTLKSQNLANPIPKLNYYNLDGNGVSSYFPSGATAMNDLTPFGSYDISSHFTPNVPVTASPPQTDVRGFKVLVGGYYDIKLSMIATLTYGQQRFIQSVDLAIFDGAGTLKKIFREHRNTAQQASTYQISTISSVIWKLDVNDVVVYSYTAQQDNLISTAYIEATVSFVYYGPGFEPSEPSFLLRTSASATTPVEEVFDQTKHVIPASKEDTRTNKRKMQEKLYSHEKTSTVLSNMAHSISSRGQQDSAQSPMFSLNDMEHMVKRILVQQQQHQQFHPSTLSSFSSSSSPSSSSVSFVEPTTTSRKRPRTSSSSSSEKK